MTTHTKKNGGLYLKKLNGYKKIVTLVSLKNDRCWILMGNKQKYENIEHFEMIYKSVLILEKKNTAVKAGVTL